MKSLAPYLSFNGNAREALGFYKELLGGKLEIMTWADAPADACGGERVQEALKDKVMHGCLTSGAVQLMAADSPQGQPTVGNNVHLCIECESVEEINRLFEAVGKGGKTVMPLDNTFWGARFGMVTDKYGIHWMLNCPLK